MFRAPLTRVYSPSEAIRSVMPLVASTCVCIASSSACAAMQHVVCIVQGDKHERQVSARYMLHTKRRHVRWSAIQHTYSQKTWLVSGGPVSFAHVKHATRLLGGLQRGQVLRQLAGLGASVLLDAVVLLARRVIQLQLPLRRLITQLLFQRLLGCHTHTHSYHNRNKAHNMTARVYNLMTTQ